LSPGVGFLLRLVSGPYVEEAGGTVKKSNTIRSLA
jgi:hypothetical protein